MEVIYKICDAIKHNESLIMRYSQAKGQIFFVFLLFTTPSTACISGTNLSIFMGFSAKCGIQILDTAKYKEN